MASARRRGERAGLKRCRTSTTDYRCTMLETAAGVYGGHGQRPTRSVTGAFLRGDPETTLGYTQEELEDIAKNETNVGETTKIQWTDHTFNAWWGCTKVSPGCDHCYAESLDRRIGGEHWGAGRERRTFGDKHWAEPLKWNVQAEREGRRHRVFSSSMADVFDAEAPDGELGRLWSLIRLTPNLDWQLLTKRASRIAQSLPTDWGDGYSNVWLGVTVENSAMFEARVKYLRGVRAFNAFLSFEPLLEDLRLVEDDLIGIDWVIVGGESGSGSRPFAVEWARAIVEVCRKRDVACFVKQMGSKPTELGQRLRLADSKGGDWEEWPCGTRVREFPSN